MVALIDWMSKLWSICCPLNLERMYTLDRFSTILANGDNSCNCLLLSFIPNLFLKRVYSEWKEFALLRSKFFLYREDPCWQGKQNSFFDLSCLSCRWIIPLNTKVCQKVAWIFWLVHCMPLQLSCYITWIGTFSEDKEKKNWWP